jgi:outer membrane protein TolC
MLRVGWHSRFLLALLAILGLLGWEARTVVLAQQQAPSPKPLSQPAAEPPVPFSHPAAAPGDKPLPINLPTALHLGNARALDIALASQRIQAAVAQLERAHVLWLPSLQFGVDYLRHDGRIQDVGGVLFDTSRSAFLAGVGPNAVFAVTDAIFEPLAARQVVRARQAAWQAATNDTLLAVAESYFNAQQARGELAGAEDAARRAEDLVRRTTQLAPGLVPPVEVARARTELARRRQAVHQARERWRIASAELLRILRMDPQAQVEPVEPPTLQVTLISLHQPLDDLITLGLLNRPELAAQQALVEATLQRLRQERLRPLIPSVLLRGAATNPAGTLSSGVFGGGRNDHLSDFAMRNDLDVQLLWQFDNLGFGNRARVKERRAENQLALLDLFRTQDRVAAEVVQAHAQVISAKDRVAEAESGLKYATESAAKNFEGLGQTRRAGEMVLLVIRPQEAVAAVQALAQAYNDYFGTIADYNRAQFRLYRALGHPAQALAAEAPACPTLPPDGTSPAAPARVPPGSSEQNP